MARTASYIGIPCARELDQGSQFKLVFPIAGEMRSPNLEILEKWRHNLRSSTPLGLHRKSGRNPIESIER
jgi:hypothetical protein